MIRRSKMSAWGREPREMRAAALTFSQRRAIVAPYQIRTCVRCGHRTTFVLEDAAGGWYSCIECGGYG